VAEGIEVGTIVVSVDGAVAVSGGGAVVVSPVGAVVVPAPSFPGGSIPSVVLQPVSVAREMARVAKLLRAVGLSLIVYDHIQSPDRASTTRRWPGSVGLHVIKVGDQDGREVG
jgi:hypothetical protein